MNAEWECKVSLGTTYSGEGMLQKTRMDIDEASIADPGL